MNSSIQGMAVREQQLWLQADIFKELGESWSSFMYNKHMNIEGFLEA